VFAFKEFKPSNSNLCERNFQVKALSSLIVLLLSSTIATTLMADDVPAPADNASVDNEQEARERAFEESLTGVTLVGFFTDSAAEDQELSEDRYTIESVTKGKNGFWVFRATIQYGGRDVKMAMPLQVEWAGDTPMITLTNIPVPQLGIFSARILFYDGRYAGTWSGTDHGGHMFGKILKEEATEEAAGDDPETP